MTTKTCTLFSISISDKSQSIGKRQCNSALIHLDGFEGDAHRGYTRGVWAGDKDPEGTVRRNERQWSGISVEELEKISRNLDLEETLSADTLGVNICLDGIEGFSQLPGGSRLAFPSGAVLVIEEYNPPCIEMSEHIAGLVTTRTGTSLARGSFSKAAMGIRGVVGVVDVAGEIHVGDEVTVQLFEVPRFAQRPA